LTLCCTEHTGTATSEIVLRDIEEACQAYEIDIKKNVLCLVSDTESKMTAAGREFEDQSLDDYPRYWHGCVAHIIELTTGRLSTGCRCANINVYVFISMLNSYGIQLFICIYNPSVRHIIND
jgi:hypothetical protein